MEYTTKDGKVDHTVSVPANSYVDFGISGTGNGEYQAKPNSPTTEIEIDGVTFTGNGVYDLDHPMDAGVTAQVPGGKSVEVTGSNDGEFKVENKSSTDVTVTGYAGNNHGSVELSNGQEVDVTVGDGKPTNFKAAKDGTELGLNTVKDGDSTRDVVELKAGAVTLPADATKNQSVYVNGVDVENTDTDSDLTVTMEKPAAGNATVSIPDGGEADIGGVKYKGPAEVVIDSEGHALIASGKVTLHDHIPDGKVDDVKVKFPSG